MIHLDNPAGRLHDILARLQRRARQNLEFNVDQPATRAALGDELGITSRDPSERYRREIAMLRLPIQIRAEVRALGYENQAILVRHLSKIEDVLPLIFRNTSLEAFTAELDAPAMEELETCSEVLHQHRPQGKFVQKEERSEIRKQVTSLISDVLQSDDLPTGLRRFLLDHLREIERALDLFAIEGPAALKGALERSAGSLVLQPALREEVKDSNLGARFMKIIGHVGTVLRVAKDGLSIAGLFIPDLGVLESTNNGSVDADVVDAEVVEEPEESPPDSDVGLG